MRTQFIPVFVASCLLSACSLEPQPIQYGHDRCVHCRMTLTDSRYGTQIVTTKGKAYTFDAIECLTSYLEEYDEVAGQVHSLWVTDFNTPGLFIEAEEALYLHSPNLHSPMGMGLAAFSSRLAGEQAWQTLSGDLLTWQELMEQMEKPGMSHTGARAFQPAKEQR